MRTLPIYSIAEKDARGYRLVATPRQLYTLLAYWLQQGIDLEPEKLVDILPLLVAFYAGKGKDYE